MIPFEDSFGLTLIDTSPKRKRGNQLAPSLARRAGVESPNGITTKREGDTDYQRGVAAPKLEPLINADKR